MSIRLITTILSVAIILSCSATSAPNGTGGSSTDSTGSGKACVPGDQKGCDCIGGSKGIQVCNDDGTGYGVCVGCGGIGGAGGASSSASTGASSSGSGGPPLLVQEQILSPGNRSNLRADADGLYWLTGFAGEEIDSSGLDGKNTKIVKVFNQSINGIGFIPCGGDIALSHVWQDGLYRLPKAGGQEVPIVTGRLTALCCDTGNLYWTTQGASPNTGSVYSESTTIASGVDKPSGIVYDSSLIYWADWPTISVAASIGGQQGVVANIQTSPRSMIGLSGNLYWIHSGGAGIFVVPMTGGVPAPISVPNGNFALSICSDGSHVYYGDIVDHKVRRLDGTAGATTEIVVNATPGNVVCYGAYIYWIDESDGSVYRVKLK